jgi:hypothetical protein
MQAGWMVLWQRQRICSKQYIIGVSRKAVLRSSFFVLLAKVTIPIDNGLPGKPAIGEHYAQKPERNCTQTKKANFEKSASRIMITLSKMGIFEWVII